MENENRKKELKKHLDKIRVDLRILSAHLEDTLPYIWDEFKEEYGIYSYMYELQMKADSAEVYTSKLQKEVANNGL